MTVPPDAWSLPVGAVDSDAAEIGTEVGTGTQVGVGVAAAAARTCSACVGVGVGVARSPTARGLSVGAQAAATTASKSTAGAWSIRRDGRTAIGTLHNDLPGRAASSVTRHSSLSLQLLQVALRQLETTACRMKEWTCSHGTNGCGRNAHDTTRREGPRVRHRAGRRHGQSADARLHEPRGAQTHARRRKRLVLQPQPIRALAEGRDVRQLPQGQVAPPRLRRRRHSREGRPRRPDVSYRRGVVLLQALDGVGGIHGT